jgi:hypothetical protein
MIKKNDEYNYLPAKHASMVTPDLCNRYSALSGCGTLWYTNWDRNPALLYIVRLWNVVGHELGKEPCIVIHCQAV